MNRFHLLHEKVPRRVCRGKRRPVRLFFLQEAPFDKVMDALSFGKVYVRGTAYRNIDEMEKALQGEKVK